MSVAANYTLYLAAEGDSVEIKSFESGATTIPEQTEASACKTHKQVLTFLEKMNESTVKGSLSFYHAHNPAYDAHLGTWPKGAAHPCPLDKQIDFVRYKIGEQAHGVRQAPKSSCVIQ